MNSGRYTKGETKANVIGIWKCLCAGFEFFGSSMYICVHIIWRNPVCKFKWVIKLINSFNKTKSSS